MKRKKIFKILSATVCLIIISALFLVPVSADTYNSVISRVVYGDNILSTTYSDYTEYSISRNTFRYYRLDSSKNYKYTNVHFYISPSIKFVVGDVVTLSGILVLPEDCTKVSLRNISDYYSTKDFTSFTSITTPAGNSFKILNLSYSYTYSKTVTDTDEFRFSVTTKSYNYMGLGLADFGFYLNNDPSVSAQAQTDALKQNQDKNTDKLLNGGHSSAPYGSTDKSSLEQNDKLSSDVDSATLEARSSTISFFNNFSSLISSSGGLYRGLMAISKVFNAFFSISWLSNIVKFGLAIGSFAFVIGSVSMVVGKLSSDKSSSQRKTNYDRNVTRRK